MKPSHPTLAATSAQTNRSLADFPVPLLTRRYRASGLNLLTAAIVLWNTVYLERAADALRGHGQSIRSSELAYDFFRFLRRP